MTDITASAESLARMIQMHRAHLVVFLGAAVEADAEAKFVRVLEQMGVQQVTVMRDVFIEPERVLVMPPSDMGPRGRWGALV